MDGKYFRLVKKFRIFLNDSGSIRKILSISFEKDGSIYIDFSSFIAKGYSFGHITFPKGTMGPVDLSLKDSKIKHEHIEVAPKMTFHASGQYGINKRGLLGSVLGYIFPPIWISGDPLSEIDGHVFSFMAVKPDRFKICEKTRETDLDFVYSEKLISFKIIGYLNDKLGITNPKEFNPLRQIYDKVFLSKNGRNNQVIAVRNTKLRKWLLLEFQPNIFEDPIKKAPKGVLSFWFGWKRSEMLAKSEQPSWLALMSDELGD